MVEISKSVGVLDSTSGKINDSMSVTETISRQIAVATEHMAKRTVDEVTATEDIKGLVQDGVAQIQTVSNTSSKFTEQIHNILNGIQNKTDMVCSDIRMGQESVTRCAEHVQKVDISFKKIAENTTEVLSQAREIEQKSKNLENLLGRTLEDVEISWEYE